MAAQLALFAPAPLTTQPPLAWWLSTPAFTCLVEVDAAGLIGRTAPVLRVWQGQPLARLATWCWERWGTAYRKEVLPC
jgi:hypothetical protein